MPENLQLLTKLTELDLANNNITDVPELPPNLKLLNLSSNDICSVPSQIYGMLALDTVLLSHNKIASWGELGLDFNKSAIKTIDISFNVEL